MSFDNPSSSSFAHWHSSIASTTDKQSQAQSQPRQTQARQSPWGQPLSSSGTKRGLTPLATSNLNAIPLGGTRSQHPLTESELYTTSTSPSSANFPPLGFSSSARFGSRRATPPSSSHSNSPVTGLQTGAHQLQTYQTRSITSPRSRTITPSQSNTGAAGNTSQPGLGAAGGGHYTRSGAYSPSLTGAGYSSPTTYSFERSPSISSNVSAAAGGPSSFSKISATQILLLLDTISEREGKVKWESKVEKIRKLLDSNGMEVFAQFFRRTVSLNAAAIFSAAKDFDQGSYKLLRQELDKVLWDPEQATKISEAIDTSKEDLFRDFDLVTFIQHFYVDTFPQVVLAIAFTKCTRADLRLKAESFLSDFGATSLRTLAEVRGNAQAYSADNICIVIEYYALAKGTTTQQQKIELWSALTARCLNVKPEQFAAPLTSSQLLRITNDAKDLARSLLQTGPKAIATKQAAQDLLGSFTANVITEQEAGVALLFITISVNRQYDMKNLVAALQTKSLDWNLVIQTFDIPGLRLRRDYFSKLFSALWEVACANSQFDLQKLWGGQWQNPDTQISFLGGFLGGLPKETQFSKLPGLRSSLSLDDFKNQSAELRRLLEAELATPYVSAEA